MPPRPAQQSPQILARQPGETAYAYRKRRSIALTGETPYQRRIRLGRAAGKTTTESRGQRPGESRRRYARTVAATGFTPWQIWSTNQVQWLTDNGFEPATTGWSWNRLIRIAPRLRYIMDVASPGASVTPDMIRDAVDFEESGDLPSQWTWERINEKYEDIYEFYTYGNKDPARMHYFQDRIEGIDVAWWYYH